MSATSVTDRVKPTENEILELARREVDPARVGEFQPIVKGPYVAVIILAAVAVAAIPANLYRLLARALRDRS